MPPKIDVKALHRDAAAQAERTGSVAVAFNRQRTYPFNTASI